MGEAYILKWGMGILAAVIVASATGITTIVRADIQDNSKQIEIVKDRRVEEAARLARIEAELKALNYKLDIIIKGRE